MPIPPPPFTLRCLDCNWRVTVVPRSDALPLGRDDYTCCPRCAGQHLSRSTASPAAAWLARLRARLS